MRVITALQLRKKLGQVLDEASAGDRIVIERDHRPLAMLVSYEDGTRLLESEEERKQRALAALEALEQFRERMARKYPHQPGDREAVTLVREDRSRDDPGSDRGLISPEPGYPSDATGG